MKIVVKDAKVHAVTGYMEVDVVAVNEKGVHGPVKTYGTDAHQLQAHYNGNISLWLASVKGMHLLHSGHHETLAAQLLEMKGKEL
jgi:hypothetical protein